MELALRIILALMVLVPLLMVVFRPQIDRWCMRKVQSRRLLAGADVRGKAAHANSRKPPRKKTAYSHPLFGAMIFVKVGAGNSYWEGRATFAPTKDTIEVFVDGDESGVAAGSVDFYAEVERRYSGIVALHRAEIDRQMRGLSDGKVPERFENAYRLNSVSVADTTLRKDWSLGFDCLFDEGFSVSIEMSDWEHGVVVVDS